MGSEPAAEQLREPVGLFDGFAAREGRDRRRAGCPEHPLHLVERVVPRHLLEVPRAALPQWGRDPVGRAQVVVGEASLVAQPALVDLRVDPRLDALDLPFARGRADVAADRAEAADGRHVLDLPRPGFEAVLRRGQGADRADLRDVAGEVAAVGLVLEGRDDRLRAAVDGDEQPILRDLLAEPRAAVAEDAALAVERDQRRDRDRLLEGSLREHHSRRPGAVAERQVLQRALAALVADRAVQRMVDENELERRVLPVGCDLRGAPGVDDHPVLRAERAGRLQLRDPLDLDEAHAACTHRRAEAGLVAEDGDLDPGRLRGLDQARPLRHLDGTLVDRDRDRVGRGLRHAGTSTAGTIACIATGASTWSSGELSPKGQPPCSMCATNSSRNFAT